MLYELGGQEVRQKVGQFRFLLRPEGVPDSRYSLVVLAGDGCLHLPLTEFYRQMERELTGGAARSYLSALLPYFTYLETDPWRREAGNHWDAAPEVVREAVRGYLLQQLGCKVRRNGTHDVVRLTAHSPSTVRVFLSALKRFYQHAVRSGIYRHENPLVDPVAQVLQAASREAEAATRPRPRMPQESGVEEPRPRRLSENYFRLAGDAWVPAPIDDLTLPGRLLAAMRQAGLALRDQVVVRMALESGARISEVLGLTVGDWRARGLNQEAAACSKGSAGRRVKSLRFSPETAKLLHRYTGGERQALDRLNRGLEDLPDEEALFLSARSRPYGYKAFYEQWQRLCKVGGLELRVHQLRHFYVTQAMRLIYETAEAQAEVLRRQEELLRYMAWRSAATLNAYEHYFQVRRHAEIQDELHRRIYTRDQGYIQGQNRSRLEPGGDGWGDLLALGGQAGE